MKFKRSIVLNGKVIHYDIRVSKRAKNVRLTITQETGLTVTVPYNFALNKAEEIIKTKQTWILDNLEKIPAAEKPRRFVSGEELPFMGGKYKLLIRSSDSLSVTMEEESLVVTVPDSLTGTERRAAIRGALEKWYIRKARSVIPKRVAEINREFGYDYNKVVIKNQRTRWGSCSQLKNLNFNWRLLLAPPEILDYIIIHELAHLEQLNHSPAFWNLVEAHCPDYRSREKWLKKHGQELKLL